MGNDNIVSYMNVLLVFSFGSEFYSDNYMGTHKHNQHKDNI